MKNKKGITITNAFQKILKECNRKPNKIWVDKENEFYGWDMILRSMKSWLGKNGREIYSNHHEGKSVIAQRFMRTVKNKFIKTQLQIQKTFMLAN